MTPAYSRVFFPVVEFVFQQAEVAKSKFADPEAVESHHIRRIQQLIRHEIDSRSWELRGIDQWEEYAKYALVVWIDLTIQRNPILGRRWRESPLEVHYFRSSLADEQFFKRCESARQLRFKDAIEFFFLCFVLGVGRIYADPVRVEQLGLPANAKEWRRSCAKLVIANRLPPNVSSKPAKKYGNFQESGRRQLQFAIVALTAGSTFFFSVLFSFWELIFGK